VLTVAPSPNTSRPSFFDISGRAKWDAWAQASKTYEGRPSEAEQRYLAIARSLGWEDGATTIATADKTEEDAERSGGGTGMGVSVSVVSPPSPDAKAASDLHGYAMAMDDDVAAISAFLRDTEGLDINARDEYVSLTSWRLNSHLMYGRNVLVAGLHCAAFGSRSREHRRSRAFA
jgi:Acyl CoA binding protein